MIGHVSKKMVGVTIIIIFLYVPIWAKEYQSKLNIELNKKIDSALTYQMGESIVSYWNKKTSMDARWTPVMRQKNSNYMLGNVETKSNSHIGHVESLRCWINHIEPTYTSMLANEVCNKEVCENGE